MPLAKLRRTALAVALAATFLAGCASPEPAPPRHYVNAVIATADFPPPSDHAAIEQVAASLGWRNVSHTPVPGEGFSIVFHTPEGDEVTTQRHPMRTNWSATRVYNVTGGGTGYATAEEATAAAGAFWPSFEDDFERIVVALETAGGWRHSQIRTSCSCSVG